MAGRVPRNRVSALPVNLPSFSREVSPLDRVGLLFSPRLSLCAEFLFPSPPRPWSRVGSAAVAWEERAGQALGRWSALRTPGRGKLGDAWECSLELPPPLSPGSCFRRDTPQYGVLGVDHRTCVC